MTNRLYAVLARQGIDPDTLDDDVYDELLAMCAAADGEPDRPELTRMLKRHGLTPMVGDARLAGLSPSELADRCSQRGPFDEPPSPNEPSPTPPTKALRSGLGNLGEKRTREPSPRELAARIPRGLW